MSENIPTYYEHADYNDLGEDERSVLMGIIQRFKDADKYWEEAVKEITIQPLKVDIESLIPDFKDDSIIYRQLRSEFIDNAPTGEPAHKGLAQK